MRAREMPAAEMRTSFENRVPSWIIASARRAAHRIADEDGVANAERLGEVMQLPPVAPDRDLPWRHRRVAEARKVESEDAVVAGEVGDVLEEVCQQPARP